MALATTERAVAQVSPVAPVAVDAAAAPSQDLPAIEVFGSAEPAPGKPVASFAGGQVARGGRVGTLGNRDVFDTPFSVMNVTAQQAQDTQAASVGDLVAADPSVRSMAARGTHYDQLAIRGFHLFNAEFMYDGLYGILPDQAFTVEMAERVEIMKGPNAFLNGASVSGNIAGAVNVLPKRAADQAISSVGVGYATQSQRSAHLDLSRRFGANQEWGIRTNAVTRDGDSVVRGQGHHVDALATSIDYRNERLRASVDLGYQNQRDTSADSFLSVAPGMTTVPRAPKGDFNYQPPWTYVHTENFYGLARGEFLLSDAVTLFAAVGGSKNRYHGLRGGPTLTALDGRFTEVTSFLGSFGHTVTSEAGARWKLATGPVRQEVVLSGNHLHQNTATPDFYYPVNSFGGNLYQANTPAQPAIGGTSLGSLGHNRLTSLALADILYAWEDRVQLTLGARHQRIVADTLTLAGATTARYDKSKTTPFVGLVVKPTAQFSLYANYIQGFSRGPTAPAGTINAGQLFDPIQSRSRELGGKYDFGRVGMTLSLFELRQPQAMATALAGGGARYGVDGVQRNRGVEYTVFGEAAHGVRVLGGVTLLDPKLLRTAGGVNDGKTGVGAPRTSLNAGVDVDVPGVPGLALNARVLYTSSQYLTASNTQQIPSWTRADLGARYAFAWHGTRLTARFNIENVADRAYWATATRGFLSRGGPRTLLASLTADF